MVSRYAIHFGSRGVSFTCKKYGQGLPALHTLKGNSTLQNISAVYGSQLAQELVPFEAAENWGAVAADNEAESAPAPGTNDTDDDKFSYSAKGFISNANFNRATGIFLLFINDRLVQSAKLKRAFDNVYSEYVINSCSLRLLTSTYRSSVVFFADESWSTGSTSFGLVAQVPASKTARFCVPQCDSSFAPLRRQCAPHEESGTAVVVGSM